MPLRHVEMNLMHVSEMLLWWRIECKSSLAISRNLDWGRRLSRVSAHNEIDHTRMGREAREAEIELRAKVQRSQC
jgi:hypothetical protein